MLRALGAALVLALAVLAAGLGWAHVSIRNERPALPDSAALNDLAEDSDRPVQLTWIETASQRSGDSGDGEEARRIVHPVFVLEWADGRLLLVDTGMDAAAAAAFGRPAEWLLGSQPMDIGRSVGAALAGARRRVAGVTFTHLHMDHTQGLIELCSPGAAPLLVFATPGQTERANYGTKPGLAHLRQADCAQIVELADAGLARLPGFPGVGVIRVAGHTPGSQVVVAWIADATRGIALAGDVVFQVQDVRDDRPKPWVYRVFITPEAEAQLQPTRRWLGLLERDHGYRIIPSHDQEHLESLALPRFDAE